MKKLVATLLFVSACGGAELAPAALDAGATADAAAPDARVASGEDASVQGDAAVPGDAAPSDAGGSGPANRAGRYDETIEVEGERRELIVYVPARAEARAVPVVFMLHGTSGDGQRFFDISGWKERADLEGFIAVFPSALTYCYFEDDNGDGDYDDPGEQKVTTKWVSGVFDARAPLCTPAQLAALPPARRARADHPERSDVLFFDRMLDHLAARYAVDARRIYASGFSNGGSMSSRLALERSTRFAAVASASGFLAVPAAAAERPIPMVLSVGSADDRFTEAFGVPSIPTDEAALLAEPHIQGLLSRYLTLAQLTQDYAFEARMVGGNPVSRVTFSTSTVGAGNVLVFAVLGGLGHQYPNGDNHPVNMSAVLWEFFAQHAL